MAIFKNIALPGLVLGFPGILKHISHRKNLAPHIAVCLSGWALTTLLTTAGHPRKAGGKDSAMCLTCHFLFLLLCFAVRKYQYHVEARPHGINCSGVGRLLSQIFRKG